MLIVLATAAFRERDLMGGLLRGRVTATPVVRSPSGNPLLRLPVLRNLWQQRLGLIGWVVGTMVGAALIVSLARSTGKLLASVSGFNRFVAVRRHQLGGDRRGQLRLAQHRGAHRRRLRDHPDLALGE